MHTDTPAALNFKRIFCNDGGSFSNSCFSLVLGKFPTDRIKTGADGGKKQMEVERRVLSGSKLGCVSRQRDSLT